MGKKVLSTQEKLTSEEILGKLLHGKAFTSEVKTVEDNQRTLLVKISSINPDRSNDIVDPKGADLTNYLKNPVVLLSHNYQSLPIAKCIDIQILDDSIIAKVLFPNEGIYDVADVVYNMCKEEFLNGWSIAFIPTEYTERKDDNGWGYTFTKWQLLEFSAVAVPDNQDAVTIMRSKGIKTEVLEAEHTLEEAEAALKTLDEIEEKTEEIETKDVEQVEKSGRKISAKNETLLRTAIDALNQVLADLEEDDADGGEDEAQEEGKTIEPVETPTEEQTEKKTVEPETTTDEVVPIGIPVPEDEIVKLLSEMRNHIRKSDKHTGLALKNMKELITIATTSKSVEKGGEK